VTVEDEGGNLEKHQTRWTKEEKAKFVDLFWVHGRDWKAIAQAIETKNAKQIKNFYQNNRRKLNLEKWTDSSHNKSTESGSTGPLAENETDS
jgi:hypothetical protein